jgi:hypothetical protein
MNDPPPTFSKEQARKLLDAPAEDTLAGLRDRAILAVGLKDGLQRSEIAALKVGDLHQNCGFDTLRVVRHGRRRDALRINPQTAARLRAYLEKAGHSADIDGPLFRPPKRNSKREDVRRRMDPGAIDRVVRKYADALELGGDYSAHSMRAFFIAQLETDWPYVSPLAKNPHELAARIEVRRVWLCWLLSMIVPPFILLGLSWLLTGPLAIRPGVPLIALAAIYIGIWYFTARQRHRRYRELFVNHARVYSDIYRLRFSLSEPLLQESHQAAVRVIQAFRQHGQPYGLFLRNFDAEAYDYITPPGTGKLGGSQDIITISRSPGSIQTKIAAALKPWAELVSIANPTNNPADCQIPQLQVPTDQWQRSILRLLADASIIIFDLGSVSKGIIFELRAILSVAKQNETIIILESEVDRTGEHIVKIVGGAITENPTIHSPELLEDLRNNFNRIVQSAEIPFDNLRLSPVFGDVLETIENRLNDLAAGLQAEGDLGGARSLFEHVVAIREKMLGSAHRGTADA